MAALPAGLQEETPCAADVLDQCAPRSSWARRPAPSWPREKNIGKEWKRRGSILESDEQAFKVLIPATLSNLGTLAEC
uniref:Uncharacterized protein n=1 Tax=Oryza meridionalis TaxID=40149 RepID=A0A0E0EQJ0_9ORYZ